MLQFKCIIILLLTFAETNINVGKHYLIPNQANQKILIWVIGSELIQGMNFNAQIGAGQYETAPEFQNADLLTGTIFESNHLTPMNLANWPHLQIWTIVTEVDTVLANGLLVTFTIDTTGFNEGSWAFNLKDTLNGPTDFATAPPPSIIDGSITIAYPGDANLDGIVGPADLSTLAIHWGQAGDWADGDFNGDGRVGIADLSILAFNWGKILETQTSR